MARQERDTFLATAERLEPWWAPAWTVQVLTGLRPGELLALAEPDLHLDARMLRVERSLSDDGERIDTPKGGIGRDVDLSNEAVRVLRAHLTRRREEKLRRLLAGAAHATFLQQGWHQCRAHRRAGGVLPGLPRDGTRSEAALRRR